MRQSRARAIHRHTVREVKVWAALFGSTALTVPVAGQNSIRLDDPLIYAPSQYTRAITASDLDDDAQMDIAVVHSGAVQVYFNQGDGTLEHGTSLPYELGVSQLASADIDSDRHNDLIWIEQLSSREYVLTIWYNSGDGSSGEAIHIAVGANPLTDFLLGDITGDGLLDIVYRESATVFAVLESAGGRDFRQRTLFEYPLSHYTLMTLVMGDFDLDGDLDITGVAQHIEEGYEPKVYDTVVSLLSNDGTGRMSLQSESPLLWRRGNERLVSAMAAGDFEGDGDLDLAIGANFVTRHREPLQLLIAKNENFGSAFVQANLLEFAIGSPSVIEVADLDVSGRLDLLVITPEVRAVYALDNQGDLEFEVLAPFVTGVGEYSSSYMAVADLSPDGHRDVAVSGGYGFSMLENITRTQGPRLSQSEMRRGQMATFAVTGALPNSMVYFLYGMGAPGNTLGQRLLGGLTVDLPEPFDVIGAAMADSQGRAVLRRRIPLSAPLDTITTQAAIRSGPGGVDSAKSPARTVRIEP